MTNKQYQQLFNNKLDLLLNLLIQVIRKENYIMATIQDINAAIRS